MLTAQIPFGDDTNPLLVHQLIDSGERPFIPQATNPEYAKLIRDCWETEPSKRPTMDQVLERLDRCLWLYITERRKKKIVKKERKKLIFISSFHCTSCPICSPLSKSAPFRARLIFFPHLVHHSTHKRKAALFFCFPLLLACVSSSSDTIDLTHRSAFYKKN